ncbi:MAG: aromatic ring-hydroxylating oxygenase subunit alpha [Gammaproteobacteria bacterium]|jgi:phenylpropionate dioxygenase-like ring-hydroxylating dioxygenase large terminal subunit
MKQSAQIDLLKEMLVMIDGGTAYDAGQLLKNPTSSYVCKERAQREWETMFENHPQVIGLSGDLPESGSFMTNNDLGIPILATRDKAGKFHAFVNACRHRGAVLTEDERGKKHRFVCPFHAWTFADDGRLLGIREPKMFGEIDKSCHGLVELPSAEKYGLLVIHPQVDGVVDIDELLGGLAEEFESWDFGKATYVGGSSLDKKLNWKIANDTFGENYHFHTLHAKKLNNLFHGDATAYHEFGRNHRLTLASRYLDVLREQPEEKWNVTDAGVLAYHVFPNTQIVMFNRVISVFRIYPNRDEVGRSLTRISHYEAQHIGAELADEATELTSDTLYTADMSTRIEFNLDTQTELVDSTLEHEDYYMGEKSQQSAASGRVEHFIFGRNEPALQHFHTNYCDVLGLPPLEEYRAAG